MVCERLAWQRRRRARGGVLRGLWCHSLCGVTTCSAGRPVSMNYGPWCMVLNHLNVPCKLVCNPQELENKYNDANAAKEALAADLDAAQVRLCFALCDIAAHTHQTHAVPAAVPAAVPPTLKTNVHAVLLARRASWRRRSAC